MTRRRPALHRGARPAALRVPVGPALTLAAAVWAAWILVPDLASLPTGAVGWWRRPGALLALPAPTAAACVAVAWRSLQGMLALAVLAVTAAAAGARTLRWLEQTRADRDAARSVWCQVTGLATCGLVLLGLGWTGLLHVPLLLGGGGLAAAGLLSRRRRSGIRRPVMVAGPADRAAVAVGLVALAAMWSGAAAPPVQFDALNFHLDRAQAWSSAGRIAGRDTRFPDYPGLGEALLAALHALGGEAAANLLAPWCAVLAAGLLRRAVPGLAGPGAAVAAAVWLAAYPVMASAAGCKGDLLVAVFVLGGWLLALRGRARSAGWLAGAACAVKYPAAVPAIAIVAAASPGRAAAALSLLPMLPWSVRNLLLASNPVAPLGSRWFPGGLDAAARAIWDEELRGYVSGRYAGWTGALAAVRTTAVESHTLLPALALPLLVILPRRAPGAWRWSAMAGCLLAGWVAGPPQARLLLPVVALAAAVTGLGVASPGLVPGWRAGVTGIALVAAAGGAWRGWTDRDLDAPARCLTAWGRIAPDRYREARLTSWADACAGARRRMSRGDRVVVFGDLRAYGLPGRRISHDELLVPPFLRWAAQSRDGAHLDHKIRQAGVTHLLHNVNGAIWRRTQLARRMPDDRALALWADTWGRRARLVDRSPYLDLREGELFLWALARRGPRRVPPYLPGLEGRLVEPEWLLSRGHPGPARAALRGIRRIAGESGVLSLAEAKLFHDRMTRAEETELLRRAARAGVGGAEVPRRLAGYARAAGRATEAEHWTARADALAARPLPAGTER